MTDDKLESIWNRSGQQVPKLDQTGFHQILNSTARSGWWAIRVNLRVFLVMLIFCEVFHLLNLAGATSHPVWLAVHATLAAVTLGFFIFGLSVLRELRSIETPDEPLTTLVRRQLRFFHSSFEWWIWMWSLTIWMSSFCLVVWVENQGTGFQINHVTEYAAVSACVILGSYVLFRLGHYPMIRRALATLHDLESQTCEETQRVQSLRKYWVIGTALLVVALTVTVAWTVKLWLSATP
jgi:hypothetical protein